LVLNLVLNPPLFLIEVRGLILFNLTHESRQTGGGVRLEQSRPEHFGYVSLAVEQLLLKHLLAVLVDHISILVHQVAFGVYSFALPVDQVTFLVLVENGIAQRVHFEVSQHILHVKLGEREYFRNFIVLQLFLFEQLPAVLINNVSTLVYQVTF